MRRKYIEDFSELERMLVMDTNFIQGKLAAILKAPAWGLFSLAIFVTF